MVVEPEAVVKVHEFAQRITAETRMATPVTVTIPHRLGRATARGRIEEGFGSLRDQFAGGLGRMLTCHERWEGDRLNFDAGTLGHKITGRLDVADEWVRIEVDLPGLLAGLAHRIASKLNDEGRRFLT